MIYVYRGMRNTVLIIATLIVSIGIAGCDSAATVSQDAVQTTPTATPTPTTSPTITPTPTATSAEVEESEISGSESAIKIYDEEPHEWQMEFSDLLSEGYKEFENEWGPACGYYYYDIDNSLSPEVIIKFGQDEATYNGLIFGITSGGDGIYLVGDIGLGHSL